MPRPNNLPGIVRVLHYLDRLAFCEMQTSDDRIEWAVWSNKNARLVGAWPTIGAALDDTINRLNSKGETPEGKALEVLRPYCEQQARQSGPARLERAA